MKDLTQLSPYQRVIILSCKHDAPEPLDKPGIHIDVLIGWLCCAAVSWGGLYLAYHWIRWAIKGWL